ncbi:MAG: c-type cytochrome [Acidobacteria bacterium]|nr:c-type cytochrome [Acidobacteriota bacterium]
MRRLTTFTMFGIAAVGVLAGTPAATPQAEAAPSAARIFSSKCAGCHAPDGKGSIGGAPNFADGAWQASRTDAALAASIRDGKGNLMPAWGKELTPAQIAALVRHIRGLKRS